PWSSCGNWWNTACCNVTAQNGSCTPVEEYWYRRVLQQTDDIWEAGGVQWEIVGFTALAWFLTYLIIWRGLHNSGKVIWFTALFPYVVLSVLLVRAVTLPGAGRGLLYYVTPQWEKLTKPTPWIDAGSQVFYSYGLAMGTLFALGSYNKYNHNCLRENERILPLKKRKSLTSHESPETCQVDKKAVRGVSGGPEGGRKSLLTNFRFSGREFRESLTNPF
ncbi:unnamed protein product, partial [Darwinula stevensoni]